MRASRNIGLELQLHEKLNEYNQLVELPGIADIDCKNIFVKQLVDSIRRIEYVQIIRHKNNSASCIDPYLGGFNPIKAAAYHVMNGNFEEASWLVFLLTHFGKNKFSGWRLLTDVYTKLGTDLVTWERLIVDPESLGVWIAAHEEDLKSRGGNFGNHRKYQSLAANHTGKTIVSYVNWIGDPFSQLMKFQSLEIPGIGQYRRFNLLYKSMRAVHGFGRTGLFDYLTMMGKLELIDVQPDSVYMQGATGPYTGGNLLFTGGHAHILTRSELDQALFDLNSFLEIPFGMQVLEDALCNWQKHPSEYVYFNG